MFAGEDSISDDMVDGNQTTPDGAENGEASIQAASSVREPSGSAATDNITPRSNNGDDTKVQDLAKAGRTDFDPNEESPA